MNEENKVHVKEKVKDIIGDMKEKVVLVQANHYEELVEFFVFADKDGKLTRTKISVKQGETVSIEESDNIKELISEWNKLLGRLEDSAVSGILGVTPISVALVKRLKDIDYIFEGFGEGES